MYYIKSYHIISSPICHCSLLLSCNPVLISLLATCVVSDLLGHPGPSPS